MWKGYLAILLTFLVVDAAWIATVVKPYYAREIGSIMRTKPNLIAALALYLAYSAGILLLVTMPAVNTESFKTALINGAIFGGLAYGTYTVTNYAILKDWSAGLVVSDVGWGAFVTALCAASGFLAVNR